MLFLTLKRFEFYLKVYGKIITSSIRFLFSIEVLIHLNKSELTVVNLYIID